ncbi:MAG: GHKL domain-containing protein [Oscillospiraceae bacterium]
MPIDQKWIINIVQTSLSLSIYLFFAWQIFKDKISIKRSYSRLLFIVYAICSSAIISLFFTSLSPYLCVKTLGVGLWLVLFLVFSHYLLRSSLTQLVFYVFMAFNIQFNLMFIARILTKAINLSWLFKSYEAQLLAFTVFVLLVFLPALQHLFVGLFKRAIDEKIDSGYWKYLFIVPIAAFLSCYFSYANDSIFIRKSIYLTLATTAAFSLFTYFAYTVLLRMLLKTNDSIIANEEASSAKQLLLVQSEQYRRLSENISQAQRTQHDMRHHFITLKGYISDGNLSAAESYLDECVGKVLPEDNVPVCQKHSVDMILRHYFAMGEKAGIEILSSVNLPEEFSVADTDLCVIFGNLVENALESCQRQQEGRRFLEVNAKLINGGMLALKISNSFDGNIRQSRDRFISQKHGGVGLGTQSVKSIVERYGGTCKFTFENNIFTASVLMTP